MHALKIERGNKEVGLKTVFDWGAVAVFGCLIVLFLHRSTQKEAPRDSLWQYLAAAGGCALVNFVGNAGYIVPACAIGAAVIAFIFKVLKPFDIKP